MEFMLDTNILIYAKMNRPEVVREHLIAHRIEETCISSITLAEIEYGIAKSANPVKNRALFLWLLERIAVMPFDANAALASGAIRAELERDGRVIGPYDLLIAGHAKALGLTLVTHNTGEFSRVEGLMVEDWAR